jgi:hypothetical protein
LFFNENDRILLMSLFIILTFYELKFFDDLLGKNHLVIKRIVNQKAIGGHNLFVSF